MPPVLVPSSTKRIARLIFVIAKLNGKKIILRGFVCDVIAMNYLFSWKSNKGMILNIFPGKIYYEFWYLNDNILILFYIRVTYLIFSRWFGISNKSGKYSPDFNYTKGCLSP